MKAGTLVVVLDDGSKWSKISYDGTVGYVLTSCLRFHDRREQPIGEGTLTYNGKATGRTTINIRNSADGDSAKIAEWRTGTEILVFSWKNGWYEIERDGLRGWVQEKFLTMQESGE